MCMDFHQLLVQSHILHEQIEDTLHRCSRGDANGLHIVLPFHSMHVLFYDHNCINFSVSYPSSLISSSDKEISYLRTVLEGKDPNSVTQGWDFAIGTEYRGQ